MTLVTDPNFIDLAKGMSVSLPGLSVNQTGLSVPSIWFVPNMVIQTVRNDKRLCGKVTVQSVTLAGLSVTVPNFSINQSVVQVLNLRVYRF